MTDIQNVSTPDDDEFNNHLILDMMDFLRKTCAASGNAATVAPLVVTSACEIWIGEVGPAQVAAALHEYAARIETRGRTVN